MWAIYPNKEAIGEAEKIWRRFDPSEELTAAIVAAVEFRRESWKWKKNNGQYVPHLSRYLERQQWRDGPPPEEPKNEEDIRLERSMEAGRRAAAAVWGEGKEERAMERTYAAIRRAADSVWGDESKLNDATSPVLDAPGKGA